MKWSKLIGVLVASIAAVAFLAGPIAGLIAVTATVSAWAVLKAAKLGSVALPVLLSVATAYGLFPQLALLYYEELLWASSPFLPLDSIPPLEMALFINTSLIAISLIGVRLTQNADRGNHRMGRRTELRIGRAKILRALALGVGVLVAGVIAGALVLEFDTLSYLYTVNWGQGAVVSQALDLAPILAVAAWAAGKVRGLGRWTIWHTLGILLAFVAGAFSLRSGDRTPLAHLVFGITAMTVWPVLIAGRAKYAWFKLLRIAVAALVVILGSAALTNVRSTRGTESGRVSAGALNPISAFSEFSAGDLVMQDWASPGLLIGLSMGDQYVDPGLVLKANFQTLPVVSSLLDEQSIGEVLSRRYDPVTSQGYGDFVLREGYTLAGWPGIAVSVALFLGIALLLDRYFRRSNVPPVVSAGLIASVAILIIRSQASASVRVFLLDILVATWFYRFATVEQGASGQPNPYLPSAKPVAAALVPIRRSSRRFPSGP
jgi:hypothetical protein